MNRHVPERRRHPRIFFDRNTRPSGIISLTQPKKRAPAVTILNMSEGGLQLSLPRSTNPGLKIGNLVTLRSMQGIEQLSSLKNIDIRVIWILDNEYLDHISIGMEFQQLSPAYRLLIQGFIDDILTKHQREKADGP